MNALAKDLETRWQRDNRGDYTPVLRPQLVETDRHKPSHVGSMYLSKFTQTSRLRERVQLAVRALKPWADYFDAIAFSGMSGAIIAPSVALRLNKQMIMVRKKNKKGEVDSHSIHVIEGDIAARSYIIVDDFMASGQTRTYITERIHKRNPDAQYLGLLQVEHLEETTLEDFERRGVPYPLTQ